MSTMASTPEVCSPRLAAPGARKALAFVPAAPVSSLRRLGPRHSRLRVQTAAGLALLAALALALRPFGVAGGPEGAGAVDDRPLTVASLLETFERTEQYLEASGWHREGDTYAPGLLEGGAIDRRWQVSGVPSMSCNGITELQHLELVFEDVEPALFMDVLMNPDYGIDWNPSVQEVVYQQDILINRDEHIDAAFLARDGSRGVRSPFRKEGRELWAVTGRVIETQIPQALKRFTGGARYSADWIVSRFEPSGRGFVLATSRKSQVLAQEAGVQKGCECCISATLIAPAGVRGTVIHSVVHVDPKVPTALHGVGLAGVGAATRQLFLALHQKALVVQASRAQPRPDAQ